MNAINGCQHDGHIFRRKTEKKRPLGMPVWSDKLVQEVIRLILDAYYEPQFSEHSHGFRPERSCDTALREIYYKWPGTIWFIEGDISQCFDKLNHELLLKTLQETIHDERFVGLMKSLLEAGYMEDWTYNKTLSGVPQGGIISPTLSNILLNKLDKYVETDLIPKYTKGTRRRANPEYNHLMNSSIGNRHKGNIEKAEEQRKQAQTLSSVITDDPNFRRLRYVRYADDFLLGFIGPRKEAEEIKRQLREFLREELKLELSEEKTLITHAKSEAAKFLGHEITTIQDNRKRFITSDGRDQRSINGRIGLRVPKHVIETKCRSYMRNNEAVHRTELIKESDYTIVTTYQLEFRGIANYYQLAYNMHALNKLKRVMENSLIKTLASKFKMTMPRIRAKYKAEHVVKDKKYQVLQVVIPRKEKKPLIARWGAVPLVWDIRATLDDQPPRAIKGNRSELVQRLLAEYCEYCGSTVDLEVHHVRAMKDLHSYPGHEKPAWVVRMIALKRKAMIVCRTCHEDITHGRPLRRQSIELTEVKALQKAKTTILESRVR